jgi:hypothetical protein
MEQQLGDDPFLVWYNLSVDRNEPAPPTQVLQREGIRDWWYSASPVAHSRDLGESQMRRSLAPEMLSSRVLRDDAAVDGFCIERDAIDTTFPTSLPLTAPDDGGTSTDSEGGGLLSDDDDAADPAIRLISKKIRQRNDYIRNLSMAIRETEAHRDHLARALEAERIKRENVARELEDLRAIATSHRISDKSLSGTLNSHLAYSRYPDLEVGQQTTPLVTPSPKRGARRSSPSRQHDSARPSVQARQPPALSRADSRTLDDEMRTLLRLKAHRLEQRALSGRREQLDEPPDGAGAVYTGHGGFGSTANTNLRSDSNRAPSGHERESLLRKLDQRDRYIRNLCRALQKSEGRNGPAEHDVQSLKAKIEYVERELLRVEEVVKSRTSPGSPFT